MNGSSKMEGSCSARSQRPFPARFTTVVVSPSTPTTMSTACRVAHSPHSDETSGVQAWKRVSFPSPPALKLPLWPAVVWTCVCYRIASETPLERDGRVA